MAAEIGLELIRRGRTAIRVLIYCRLQNVISRCGGCKSSEGQNDFVHIHVINREIDLTIVVMERYRREAII